MILGDYFDRTGNRWVIYQGSPLDGTFELRAQHEHWMVTAHWYARTPPIHPKVALKQIYHELSDLIKRHVDGEQVLQWDPALNRHYLLSPTNRRDYCATPERPSVLLS